MAHIPKPFVRPSVSLGGAAARSWQTIPTSTVLVGDTVIDHGLVTQVEQGADVRVTFMSGKSISSADVLAVQAFHPVA